MSTQTDTTGQQTTGPSRSRSRSWRWILAGVAVVAAAAVALSLTLVLAAPKAGHQRVLSRGQRVRQQPGIRGR
jgi:anti-sigma-K factor RskA